MTDTIARAGELAINGTLLNAYVTDRTHVECVWRARRAGYSPNWIECGHRGRIYAERTEWLLAEAERLDRAKAS